MNGFTSFEQVKASLELQPQRCEVGLPQWYHFLGLRGWVRVSLFVRVLVEHGI